jgi:Protein of unknown function (DUF2628)
VRIYTAHLCPDRPPVLVKEGFAWGALLFGPLWLLAHRAWIAAVIAIAVFVLVGAVAPGLIWGVPVLLGFTGRDLVRWGLDRRGYALAHVVAGRTEDDAFLRLLGHRPDLAAAGTA